MIDADGAGDRDQQCSKRRDAPGGASLCQPEADQEWSPQSDGSGGGMRPSLPHAKFAGWEMAEILETQCAKQQENRRGSKSDRNCLRTDHFANTIASSAKALISSALPLGSAKNIVACSP